MGVDIVFAILVAVAVLAFCLGVWIARDPLRPPAVEDVAMDKEALYEAFTVGDDDVRVRAFRHVLRACWHENARELENPKLGCDERTMHEGAMMGVRSAEDRVLALLDEGERRLQRRARKRKQG